MSTPGDSGVNTSRNLRLRPRYAIVNVPPRAPQLTPSSMTYTSGCQKDHDEQHQEFVPTMDINELVNKIFRQFTLPLVNDTIIGGFQELFKCLNISVIRNDGKVVLDE
ncbi:20560_t:CDS:2, partial [Gigaspora margarita]